MWTWGDRGRLANKMRKQNRAGRFKRGTQSFLSFIIHVTVKFYKLGCSKRSNKEILISIILIITLFLLEYI